MGLLVFLDKFIPFKTPLDHKYDDQIPDECKFNMQMFLSSVKATYQVNDSTRPRAYTLLHFVYCMSFIMCLQVCENVIECSGYIYVYPLN